MISAQKKKLREPLRNDLPTACLFVTVYMNLCPVFLPQRKYSLALPLVTLPPSLVVKGLMCKESPCYLRLLCKNIFILPSVPAMEPLYHKLSHFQDIPALHCDSDVLWECFPCTVKSDER